MFLPLHGAHQGENAAIALAAAEAFFGRPLDADVVARGASRRSRNPGRFEVVQHDPLLILDGAHNREGAIAAAEALAEGFTVTGVTHLVIGVLDGRDPAELLEILDAESAADRRVLHARLAARAPGRGARRARPRAPAVGRVVVDDVGEALERALEPRRRPTTSCSSPARSTPSAPRAAACRRSGWSRTA